MKFYRYFGSHAYETLEREELMVSRPSSFNDPFEFLYRGGGTMTMGKAKRYIKDREKSAIFYAELQKKHPDINTTKKFKVFMRQNRESLAKNLLDSFPELSITEPAYREKMGDEHFRISSFTHIDTEPFDEILMWSHYANKHFGVRIGFELDPTKKYPYFMKEVIYSKHRVALDLTNSADSEGIKNSLIEAIRTKSEGWKYEKEFRYITLPSLCEERIVEGKRLAFVKFDPVMIWTIDFGVKCPESERRRIFNLAKARYPNAQIRFANYHKTDFALEYSEYK